MSADLDRPDSYAEVDRSDALGVVESVPDQWGEALRRARAATNLPVRHGITSVVFAGMGGSGIAGDVVAALVARHSPVPIHVVKGYELPGFVGPNTLVICASYSGNTEETLACFAEAQERKARLVTLTTGGALAERADASGCARIAPVEGLQPRAALASLAVPAIVVLERLGILPDMAADLAETEAVLAGRVKGLGRDIPTEDNEAKRLARALDGTLPVVWGQDGLLAVAAVRWRCQINENAKMPAYSAVLPELDHNDLVGYDPGIPVLRNMAIVVLRSPAEQPRVALRIRATLDEMREKVGAVVEAWATGDTALSRLMSAAILGDFASVYLALIRGVDPTPVDVITALKNRLA